MAGGSSFRCRPRAGSTNALPPRAPGCRLSSALDLHRKLRVTHFLILGCTPSNSACHTHTPTHQQWRHME
eukprot:4832725-Prymnesium_polylepis.1